MEMTVDNGVSFINSVYESILDEKLWQRWLIDYQHMTEDNFIDFENYKTLLTGKIDKSKSAEEIMKESEEILKLTEGRVKNGITI